MKLNITGKYTLILLLPMLAAITVLSVFYSFMDQIEANVPYTNIAGRQRMLSEQLHNYAQMVHIGQEEDRKPLKALISRFSDSLDVLQYGGHLDDPGVDLPAAPTEITPVLVELRQAWESLEKDFELVSTLPITDSRSRIAYAKVNAQAPALTRKANTLTSAFEKYSSELHLRMRNLLTANVVFTLFLLALGFWAARRHIVAPVLQLTDVASAIDRGDYAHRVSVNTQDELGTLADSVNSMVGSIEYSICTERKLRQRQEKLTQMVIELGSKPVQEIMITHVGQAARDITGARYASVIYDSDGERHHIPFGLTAEEESALADYAPQHAGLLGHLWEERKTMNIEDINVHPKKSDLPPGHPAMKTYLGVPILFGEEMFGIISLADKSNGQPFSKGDENAVGMLASACAIAISNTKNIEELKAANNTLETRVAKRTLDLEKTNRRLRSREIELELMNDELSRANSAKSQFLANTSHELRTPLNAIIGFSDLLNNPRMGTLSDKQRRYVNHVHVSGNRLLTIINDLLDISRIEAGMMVIDETVTVPSRIIQDVLHELNPLVREKQIELSFENEGPDESLLLDTGKLHQMLVNVVGNALKFTPEQGEVCIHLAIVQAKPDEHRIMINVRDSGCGIAEEDQEKIFEPFVQAKGGLDRAFGGTGLGLALTRKQINMLGGEIRVQSSLGAGSCFTLELPAKPEQVDSVGMKGEEQQVEEVGLDDTEISEVVPATGSRPRILIVDTDGSRAEAVESLMQQQGYKAAFSDISQVAKVSEQFCPFLIVLGAVAEDESSHLHLQQLKSNRETQNIPVILVGGDANNFEFSMAPVGMVQKGVKQEELLDLIARHNRYIPAHPVVPTILVIDDEKSVRQLLSETLVAEGYRVLLAAGGKAGIRMAVEREPDMIILDVMMPGITGFDVLKELKRHPVVSDIPVVIYTAKDLSREEALHFGREAERILIKGTTGRPELLRQLHKLELLYPAKAHLMDITLNCYNSRYIQRRMDQEVSNAKRFGTKFSLICWQVDHYDEYTGNHGERWGVAALKAMLDIVQDVTRRGDVCARMDEAQFLLFLPGVTPEGATHVAEKMRIRFRRQRHHLPDDEIGELTASFAGAHYCQDADDTSGLLQVLSDRVAMAVRAGGDQSVFGDI
jgi:diguanylate cyclase (GGDEF)-like protein